MLNRIQRAAAPFAVAAALALFFSGCSRTSNQGEAKSLKSESERQPAPGFSLKDASGTPVNMADLKGKVVLVNFWATWCGPCNVEIPWFIEFQQQYKDQGFTVVGISMDDDGWKSVKPYITAHKVNYPVVIGDETVSQLYGGIESLPTTFVVDRAGRIAAMHTGLVDRSEYQNEIVKLLEDPKQAGIPPSGIDSDLDRTLARLLRPTQRP